VDRIIFRLIFGVVFLIAVTTAARAQDGQFSGQVTDPQNSAIPKAEVRVVNQATAVERKTTTNDGGFYSVPFLEPGRYKIFVQAPGFSTAVSDELTLTVGQVIVTNFELKVGEAVEHVEVTASSQTVNTTDATVSTVVDRNFAENLPMNGRSFQTLIELTPGVVITPSNPQDSGQFSVNGQRTISNYWMVDGVSANFGTGASPGNGLAGALPSFSVLGGTNSLVSVDALQEFRIETSTYAPEFGRTPGAQISIVTRSGTNQFHGTLFDYLRNDIFDANNWFNGINILNTTLIPKAKEQQNDFGGTFSGPILRNRTFFFFSYEGLRLLLPQTTLTTVPDASFTPGGTTNSRQNAVPALQPFLNAFPLPNPNSPEILCDPTTDSFCPPSGLSGSAAFNASYSNPASLDAYSLRIDHKLSDKLALFGRYNYSPSEIVERGGSDAALSSLLKLSITTQTATVGTTWAISPEIVNDFRFNYSRAYSYSSSFLDNFGGAVPLVSLPLPSPYTPQNSLFILSIFSLLNGTINQGGKTSDIQRQFNIVDSLAVQRGPHTLKFGIDFRRLSPVFDPLPYSQQPYFGDVPSAETGNLYFGYMLSNQASTLLFRNLGIFAQDTWRVAPRLTLTYGLRWDVDFAPSSINGPNLPAATGFNLSNLSQLALASSGTPPFKTTYGNFAPRLGIDYQLSQNQDWATVLRGGFGVFYDLATGEAGNNISFSYPFGATSLVFGPPAGGTATFPLSPAEAAPPPISAASLSLPGSALYVFDPSLKLPYTLQWNIALEQTLGTEQALTASYIGAQGRRLIATANVISPNPNLAEALLVTNLGTSDYNALQVQFQRRLTHGLQALASYTWSHSIDTGSAGSTYYASDAAVPGENPNANRGSSDFDIRNAFSAGLTYDIPGPKINAFANAIVRGWSLQNVIQARSAPPVNVFDASLSDILGHETDIRPDLVPGVPVDLYGPEFPGGKALNINAFVDPPIDPSTGLPLRQGDLGRNVLRGFGATQWDFAVHRNFPIHESLTLQFRAEMFNVLNHPNFGQPLGNIAAGPAFGISNQMLGQSLNNQNLGGGAFDPLYQIGGPRSMQFALKLTF
jgi:hypothetical protein